jgi:hypothetical protein
MTTGLFVRINDRLYAVEDLDGGARKSFFRSLSKSQRLGWLLDLCRALEAARGSDVGDGDDPEVFTSDLERTMVRHNVPFMLYVYRTDREVHLRSLCSNPIDAVVCQELGDRINRVLIEARDEINRKVRQAVVRQEVEGG